MNSQKIIAIVDPAHEAGLLVSNWSFDQLIEILRWNFYNGQRRQNEGLIRKWLISHYSTDRQEMELAAFL